MAVGNKSYTKIYIQNNVKKGITAWIEKEFYNIHVLI